LRVAVVAVTRQGVKLAERTAELLSNKGGYEPVLYVPGKFSLLRLEGKRYPYRKPLRELFGELFAEYQGIVCVMALGIVIRLLAPYIKDKTTDPAVVVMDEMGKNVISALSGHWGGANELAVLIAGCLQANPVITTATDVHGLPAVEVLAREHGWIVEPFELVKKINAAIVNGSKVTIYSEAPLDIEPVGNIELKDFARYSPGRKEEGRVVLVTNRAAKSFPEGTLFLRPQNLSVGIGCRRGVKAEEVMEAVLAALEETGRAISSVRCLSSVDIKSNEEGLMTAASELGLTVEFFERREITKVMRHRGNELSFSETVDHKIGVGGVCEPAAILGAGEKSQLIMPKTKYGRVTAAVAEGSWQ